ncbi:hypothetical protein M569_14599, partial [Genlisea aurea]
MSLCFCSLLKPLFVDSEYDFLFRCSPNSLRPRLGIGLLNLRTHAKDYGVKAFGAVSDRTAAFDSEQTRGGDVNGIQNDEFGDERSRIRLNRTAEVVVDRESRFKLQNGREVFQEKAYLVGVAKKSDCDASFGIEYSLGELAQLADTAGLLVVGSTYQKLATPNPRTYIGSGKVAEIKSAIHAFGVETVIFDDELSAG